MRSLNLYFVENIALGQPTFQSTTEHDGPSSQAVDGNMNAAYDAGSCSHTADEENPWWAVDLQWQRLVDTVHLTNRIQTRK